MRIAEGPEFSEGGVVAGELTHPSPGVFQAPQASDAIVGDTKEADLVDAHPEHDFLRFYRLVP